MIGPSRYLRPVISWWPGCLQSVSCRPYWYYYSCGAFRNHTAGLAFKPVTASHLLIHIMYSLHFHYHQEALWHSVKKGLSAKANLPSSSLSQNTHNHSRIPPVLTITYIYLILRCSKLIETTVLGIKHREENERLSLWCCGVREREAIGVVAHRLTVQKGTRAQGCVAQSGIPPCAAPRYSVFIICERSDVPVL